MKAWELIKAIEEGGCIKYVFGDGTGITIDSIKVLLLDHNLRILNNLERFEIVKPKKRYWIWRVKDDGWAKTHIYLDDEGRDTDGYKQYMYCWGNMEKEKIENDFIEV